jgi:hypothetical protein
MSARLVSEALAMLCLTRAPGAAQVSGLSSRIEQSSQQRLNEFWARILSEALRLARRPSPVAVGLQLSFTPDLAGLGVCGAGGSMAVRAVSPKPYVLKCARLSRSSFASLG